MNTHELIEALRAQADFIDADTYDECWEVKETPRGKMLRAAASRLSEMDAENKRLREALDEVARPMFHMRKRAEASGQRLSDMAYNIAHSLNHVQAIARAALEHDKGEKL